MVMEAEIRDLVERQHVVDVVTRLFNSTDEKNWEEVKEVFADEVFFDLTSLAGGEPSTMTPQQIADAWDEGLKDVSAIHHQTGNHVVTLDGDRAEVFCYGIATHYRPDEEKPITTFVGSYDLHLTERGGEWKIDLFRFNSKYVH